jgi:hypothetical protein
MALLVLGLVILLLGQTAPGVSPDLSELLARTGYENLGRLFEELGLHAPAFYLPPDAVDGRIRALIPFSGDEAVVHTGRRLEDRLIAFYGDEAGILVVAPGTAAMSLLQYPPGETMDEISVAITQVAVSSLHIARHVELHEAGSQIEVRFSGEAVPAGWLSAVVESCLGSLAASIAAAVVAVAKGRTVRILAETARGRNRTVTLELQPL